MKTAAHKRQPRKQAPRTARYKMPPIPRSSRIAFAEIEGKTIKSLELWLESEEGNIVLNFTDNTVLQLDVATGYIVQAEHSNWKTGNGHLIKRWPLFPSPSPWPEKGRGSR